MPGPVLIIMTRCPLPGRCKTRLQPYLGAAGAARLQANLLRQRIGLARRLPHPAELHVHPDLRHPLILDARRRGLTVRHQQGHDLGQRMRRAQGRRPAVIIGTDAPALGLADVKHALDAVARGQSLCIPAEDGGFVLLGLAQSSPRCFDCIDWGSPHVMRQSRRQYRRASLAVAERAPCPDLDTGRDFRRERRAGRIPAFGYIHL